MVNISPHQQNPAKVTDSRFNDYQSKYGDESWELDALEPTVIQRLISDAVLAIRDNPKWEAMLQQEASDKMELEDMIEQQSGDDE